MFVHAVNNEVHIALIHGSLIKIRFPFLFRRNENRSGCPVLKKMRIRERFPAGSGKIVRSRSRLLISV